MAMVALAKTALYWLTLTIGRSRIRASHYQSSFGNHPKKWEELFQWFLRATQLEGEILEFGVHLGGTTCMMAEKLMEIGMTKTIHAFDSFGEGFHPDEFEANYANGSVADRSQKTAFRSIYNSLEYVQSKIEKSGFAHLVKLHPGYFQKTLTPFLEKDCTRRFCFALIDCDLASSVQFCAETIYDVVTPGGVILFDDYGSMDPQKTGTAYSVGVRRAVHDLIDRHPPNAHGYSNGLYHFVK